MVMRRASPLVQTIQYTPNIQDTGDLELATKPITATSEAVGIGNADYNKALTLPVPASGLLNIIAVALRLSIDLDSLSAGSVLSCRVYVDAQAAANKLFDVTFAAGGAGQLNATTQTSGTAFNLLKDGSAHTFYFFFWKDVAGVGDTVLSAVELWEGVGTHRTAMAANAQCLQLLHTGWVDGFARVTVQGTGAPVGRMGGASASGTIVESWRESWAAGNNPFTSPRPVASPYFYAYGTVATDINCITQLDLELLAP